MLRLGYVGGFGAMSAPAARHLRPGGPAIVLRTHDRGRTDGRAEDIRADWKAHGAALVPTLEDLIGPGDLDGVVVCAGKNGDDLGIIAELTQRLRDSFVARGKKGHAPFILHFSTVSNQFTTAAFDFCGDLGVDYANYPLTGGPKGAELGGADPQGMLILAGGDPALYERVEPFLRVIGQPRFFGASPAAGTTVKLIGQFMVLNGCIGISSAAGLFASAFCKDQISGNQQADFFDFLNKGAGGTRQWDVSLRKGVKDGVWDHGFFIKHAVVDALYSADAAREYGLPRLVIDPLLNVALGFAFVLRKYPGENLATHALAREMLKGSALQLDEFFAEQRLGQLSIADALERVQSTLPDDIRRTVHLEVAVRDFEAAGKQH